jgi:hypothetical protein
VRFLLVAGDGDLHRRRGKEEEKKLSQTPPVAVARGGDAPPLFQYCSGSSRSVPLQFLEF